MLLTTHVYCLHREFTWGTGLKYFERTGFLYTGRLTATGLPTVNVGHTTLIHGKAYSVYIGRLLLHVIVGLN